MGNESGDFGRTGKQRRWFRLITRPSDVMIIFLKVLFETRNGLVCRYDRLRLLFGLTMLLDSRSGSWRDGLQRMMRLGYAHQIIIEFLGCVSDLGGRLSSLLLRS